MLVEASLEELGAAVSFRLYKKNQLDPRSLGQYTALWRPEIFVIKNDQISSSHLHTQS